MRSEPVDPFTTTCLWETQQLARGVGQCGRPLAPDADWEEVFCPHHGGAFDRGEVTWTEYQGMLVYYRAQARAVGYTI